MRSCSVSTRRTGPPDTSFAARGFTLVEVVVGLTLMATLLAGSLLAFTAHRRQRMRAEQRLAAVAILDDLLTEMTGSREGIPLAARGPIASRPEWTWETGPVGVVAPMGRPLAVVRVRVVDRSTPAEPRVVAAVDVVREPR